MGRSAPKTTDFLDGATAGLVATVPMTLLMFVWHRNLPVSQRYPLPPSLITKRAFGEIALPGRPAPMPNLLATLATHFGFGGAAGAVFAMVPRELRQRYTASAGIAYGLSVWTGSYLGWVPGLGLMPPATRQPTARNAMMIAAHVVWGASLGLALESIAAIRSYKPPTAIRVAEPPTAAPRRLI